MEGTSLAKILTEEGDLAVTNIYIYIDNRNGDAVLQSKITGVTSRRPDSQLFLICNDCPQDS